MKAISDERQFNHDPKHFLANGQVTANPEQPERIKVLRSGAIAAGCEFEAPDDAGLVPIAGLNVPTLFVQEGGYLCDALGDNLTGVLSGFPIKFHVLAHSCRSTTNSGIVSARLGASRPNIYQNRLANPAGHHLEI